MKVVLATGIYPPDIGGPATYVQQLAKKMHERGVDVTVITYGKEPATVEEGQEQTCPVIYVSKAGGTVARWNRYAKALQKHAKDADFIYCFSSISCGMPLLISGLKTPRRVLRLGGDYLWERYTDIGGRRGLRGFYILYPWMRFVMRRILKKFDFIVFSTSYQERLAEFLFRRLPAHRVIENAMPASNAVLHQKHNPFRLLYLGRFVRFKNLSALIRAVSLLPFVHLTLAGEGPVYDAMLKLVADMGLRGRVNFVPPVHGEEKRKIMDDHDLMVIPSFTELSPHAAIEARAAGLPVLLTEETGLSAQFLNGVTTANLRTSEDITRSVIQIEQNYEAVAEAAASPLPEPHTWNDVASETLALFEELHTPAA
jgi:glycosyltransferase involved in cell wall biosynthesis